MALKDFTTPDQNRMNGGPFNFADYARKSNSIALMVLYKQAQVLSQELHAGVEEQGANCITTEDLIDLRDGFWDLVDRFLPRKVFGEGYSDRLYACREIAMQLPEPLRYRDAGKTE